MLTAIEGVITSSLKGGEEVSSTLYVRDVDGPISVVVKAEGVITRSLKGRDDVPGSPMDAD